MFTLNVYYIFIDLIIKTHFDVFFNMLFYIKKLIILL